MPRVSRQLVNIVFLLGMAAWLGYEDFRCARFALVGGAVVFLVLASNEIKKTIGARRQQQLNSASPTS
jgi:hypothetical protein